MGAHNHEAFSKRFLIILVFMAILIMLAAVHIMNGGTIAIGTWSSTPQQALADAMDYIEYAEIKTLYLGDEGKDGAVVFYIEDDTEYEKVALNMAYFRAKKSSSGYKFTYDSSFTYTSDENCD